MAIADDWLAQQGKQAVVELLQLLLDRLVRAATEMGRNAFASPLELSLVKEPQSWRQKGNNCRSLMNSRREGNGCARLVVVFQEAGQFVLIG